MKVELKGQAEIVLTSNFEFHGEIQKKCDISLGRFRSEKRGLMPERMFFRIQDFDDNEKKEPICGSILTSELRSLLHKFLESKNPENVRLENNILKEVWEQADTESDY